VEYALTPAGEELAAHLVPLMQWIAGHAGDDRPEAV
jgi:DNA-binding HxlR family transcriptional regulator